MWWAVPRAAVAEEVQGPEQEELPAPPGTWGDLDDGTKRGRNLARAEARARSMIRRYCVRNQLDHLVTLTYRCTACNGDPCSCGLKADRDREQVKRDVNQAMRDARVLGDGEAFPYLYTGERGKRGTRRLHVHVALREQDAARVAAAWEHGRVDVQPPRKRGQSSKARARSTAGYLAKYVAKDLYDEEGPGKHAYERSQGFNCLVVELDGLSVADAEWWIMAGLGCEGLEDLVVADSEDWEDWYGPPMRAYRVA